MVVLNEHLIIDIVFGCFSVRTRRLVRWWEGLRHTTPLNCYWRFVETKRFFKKYSKGGREND